MIGSIKVEGHEVSCIIGCLEHERRFKQKIFLAVDLQYDFSNCVKNDSLKDAIDYSALLDHCTKVLEEGKYFLLETCSKAILDKIFRLYPVLYAKVRLEKPSALQDGQKVSVELARYRNESF